MYEFYQKLKQVLRYNPKTGEWLRLDMPHLKVGYRMPNGYLRIKIDRKRYLSSVLAWFYMTGCWPQKIVDHKDNNPQNDKWLNLRLATRIQNRVNCKVRRDNKCGAKGVSFRRKNYYHAEITIRKKRINLGFYKTSRQAHLAYRKAARKYFGEFARFQ